MSLSELTFIENGINFMGKTLKPKLIVYQEGK